MWVEKIEREKIKIKMNISYLIEISHPVMTLSI